MKYGSFTKNSICPQDINKCVGRRSNHLIGAGSFLCMIRPVIFGIWGVSRRRFNNIWLNPHSIPTIIPLNGISVRVLRKPPLNTLPTVLTKLPQQPLQQQRSKITLYEPRYLQAHNLFKKDMKLFCANNAHTIRNKNVY